MTVTLPAGDGFVVKNNTGATERLRVDEATGNISRNGALFVHTTGASTNTFVGEGAGNLATSGGSNAAFGNQSLKLNTTGYDNSAFGSAAMLQNDTGSSNSAFGRNALRANTTGLANSAFGAYALYYNTANFNVAFGQQALFSNTTGPRNSAFGTSALDSNTTGERNVAIGFSAGLNQTTGSNNIYIANTGTAAESGKIKIGNSAHTETFIEGIDGNTGTGGVAVLINSSNELHTLVSSLRFKDAVRDMGESSRVLERLRPVTFRYRRETGGDGHTREYGLIAEEVAEVAPELVTLDAEGKPYSVRYHVLPSLLLNEIQKQQRTMEAQQSDIHTLLLRVEQLEAQGGSTGETVAR